MKFTSISALVLTLLLNSMIGCQWIYETPLNSCYNDGHCPQEQVCDPTGQCVISNAIYQRDFSLTHRPPVIDQGDIDQTKTLDIRVYDAQLDMNVASHNGFCVKGTGVVMTRLY